MDEPSQEQIAATWQRMAARNGWELVDDPPVFFAAVAAECRTYQCRATPSACLRQAIQRVYAVRLHEGLRARRAQAAVELWRACFYLSLRHHTPRDEAEVIAQETIARVLEKLHTLHDPRSLFTWAFSIRDTVERERSSSFAVPLSIDAAAALPSLDDVAVRVEDALLNEQVLARVRAVLTNPLEQLTLLRIIVLNEHPREVAGDLGLPLHRIRTAKSRACQKLRQDAALLALLGLADAGAPQEGNDGAPETN